VIYSTVLYCTALIHIFYALTWILSSNFVDLLQEGVYNGWDLRRVRDVQNSNVVHCPSLL